MDNCIEITGCRLCGSKELSEYISFGDTPLANDLVENINERQAEYPLIVVRCNSCLCHQLRHDIDPDILFKNYLYATSKGLEKHFKDYALTVSNNLGLSEGHAVIEIGGNTGMLCEEFKRLGFNAINIEPAKNIARLSERNGIITYCDFFSSDFANSFLKKHSQVDLVVSNNVFAHSPNISDMVDGVKKILRAGGYFVMENAYLLETIQNNDAFQIYGEHYFYHCIASLVKMFTAKGMTVTNVEFNDAQCGSFRLFVYNGSKFSLIQPIVYDIVKFEFDFFDSLNYSEFGKRVSELKNTVVDYLELNKDKKIALVGVPAKVALMIRYFDIEKYFFAAFEDAPLKVGKLVPGTSIRIRSMGELKESGAEIAYIGAYNFSQFIMDRFKDLNIEWAQPLPEFKIHN